jgi:hypothetical protein
MTPDELPADMEAVIARLEVSAIDPAPWPDLRALLKAYQEQRRALVACRGAAAPLLEQSEDRVWRRAKLIVDTVDAALNQKGDER